MYAKVFQQIYDSSIADDWTARLVFMDFLVLADKNGVVDMTHESISRRTNVPIDVVRKAISKLEQEDPASRTKTANGVRIARLDEHRDWGWIIVNYGHFRQINNEEQRRALTNERVKRYRSNLVTQCNAKTPEVEQKPVVSDSHSNSVTKCNADVTLSYASASASVLVPVVGGVGEGGEKETPFPESEIPDEKEFVAYCRSITLIADWYSRDKFLAACQENWKRQPNWRAYAARCRTWWESEGRPMSPTNKFGKPKRKHVNL